MAKLPMHRQRQRLGPAHDGVETAAESLGPRAAGSTQIKGPTGRAPLRWALKAVQAWRRRRTVGTCGDVASEAAPVHP